MSFDPLIVESLIALYTPAEIRDKWTKALNALIERSSEPILINRIDRDGQSDSGIALANPEEMKVLIASCKEALRRIEAGADGDSVDPGSLGRGTDRSHRMIRS